MYSFNYLRWSLPSDIYNFERSQWFKDEIHKNSFGNPLIQRNESTMYNIHIFCLKLKLDKNKELIILLNTC